MMFIYMCVACVVGGIGHSTGGGSRGQGAGSARCTGYSATGRSRGGAGQGAGRQGACPPGAWVHRGYQVGLQNNNTNGISEEASSEQHSSMVIAGRRR